MHRQVVVPVPLPRGELHSIRYGSGALHLIRLRSAVQMQLAAPSHSAVLESYGNELFREDYRCGLCHEAVVIAPVLDILQLQHSVLTPVLHLFVLGPSFLEEGTPES